jgi:hypothetical protein
LEKEVARALAYRVFLLIFNGVLTDMGTGTEDFRRGLCWLRVLRGVLLV